MSRKVCTYTDITKLPENPFFKEISKYPIITVSADLRKGFIGSLGLERKEEVLSFEGKLNVTEFRNITAAIDDNWTSDQSKFNQSIILSEFIRNKINGSKEEKEINWLTGCMRNLDALRSAITLVEEAEIKPDDLNTSDDRNLALLVEAWKYLVDRDPSFKTHSERMESLSSKERWEDIFFSAFKENGLSKSEAIVFHGFYYIKEVCISWISEMNEKLLAPSPYIKLISNATGIEVSPAKRNTITFDRVLATPYGPGKTEKYDREKAPRRMIKEARMAYALCPMKYTLGYVVEKYPTYESDFQQEACLKYSGERTLMVKGLAGAGKSLVLMELARKLLSKYGADSKNKVAIFTFQNTLVSTTREFLEINGAAKVCIVAIGDDFQNSLEVTSLLKELGARMVVSRAARDVHAKFLLRNGADEIVYPERQVADMVAIRYSADHIFDYIELDEEHAIFEISIPGEWIGKTIGQLDIRKKYNINIMALKTNDIMNLKISSDTQLLKDSTMLVLGETKHIQKCFHI